MNLHTIWILLGLTCYNGLLWGQCNKITQTCEGGFATGIICKQKIKASYGGWMTQEYRKGNWLFTNDDGKPYKSGNYQTDGDAGYRQGEWTWFNEEGKPLVNIEFQRDKRIKVLVLDSGSAYMGNDSVVVSHIEDTYVNLRFTEGKFHLALDKVQPGIPVDFTKNRSDDPSASRNIPGVIGINAASASSTEILTNKENIIWKDAVIMALFPGLRNMVGQTHQAVTEEQNLIVNSGLNPSKKEEGVGRLYFHNTLLKGWGTANESPDYYREFGLQFLGFRAAGSNYEVIRGSLKKRLQEGKTYCFRFDVRLKSDNNYAVNHIGAVFYDKSLSAVPARDVLAPVEAKVCSPYSTPMALRDSWMSISGSFVAKGGEAYVYVGQFSSRDSTRFWPLDSIYNGATSGEVYYYFQNPVLIEKPAGINCPCNVEKCVPDSTFEEVAESRESFVLRDVQFATGSARLLPESFASLDSLAEQLLANTRWKLEINGHTDNQGDPADNLKLSVKRSKAVFDYLTKKGVPAAGMTHNGKGDSEPLDDNETEEGRAINRRVEFVIRR